MLMVLLQAEPAPEPTPAPLPAPAPPPAAPEQPAEPTPATSLGLTVGGVYRLPPASRDVPPPLGFALSTFVRRRYATVGARLELGVAASFSYERHSRTVRATKLLAPGIEASYEGVRTLSCGDFVALHTFTLVLGRVRPWLAVGGGLSLGYFTSPEEQYKPGEKRAATGLAQAGVGFALEVAPQTDAGLQLDYARPFPKGRFVTESGQNLHLFGDRLAVRLEMQYRF